MFSVTTFFKSKARNAVLVLLCLALSVVWMLNQDKVLFYELFLVVPLFILGMASVAYGQQIPVSLAQLSPFWSKIVPVIICVVMFAGCYLDAELKTTIIVFCLFLLVCMLPRCSKESGSLWTGSIALFLGDISYSLYMTHTLAQKVLYKVVPSHTFVDANIFTRSGAFLFYVLAIFIFCLFVYYAVEKPCLSYFKKRIRKP